MNSKEKSKSSSDIKYEFLLYAVLWGIVLAYPFIYVTEMALNGGSFQWKYIWIWWKKVLPYAVLMLIHTAVLFPLFLKKRTYTSYILSVAALVSLFFVYTFVHNEYKNSRRLAFPAQLESFQSAAPPPSGPPPPFLDESYPRAPRGGSKIPVPVLIDTIIAVLMIVSNLAIRLMFDQYRGKRKIEELEKAHIQQELAQLKAQISPHFLMNSLNNIHGMVEIDAQRAQNMLLELSGMMRYVLYESSSPSISLSKEIDFLVDYISVMSVRYPQSRVAIKFKFPDREEAGAIAVPPLIFIVFIENAFKHGVNYHDYSFVNIHMSIQESRLIFHCVNSVHASLKKKDDGGIGLTNIYKRLNILYAERYTLDIDNQDKSFHVTLTIPIQYEDKMCSSR